MADDSQIVKIVRRGGIAGLPATADIVLSELPAAQRDELLTLLATTTPPAPSPGADRFVYHLSVGSAANEPEVVLPEDRVPRWLAQLVTIDIPEAER